MDTTEAQKRIKAIQNGSGLNRDQFPEQMKGIVAKEKWYDSLFSYGMEYGYLLAMSDIVHGMDSTK